MICVTFRGIEHIVHSTICNVAEIETRSEDKRKVETRKERGTEVCHVGFRTKEGQSQEVSAYTGWKDENRSVEIAMRNKV